MECDDAKLMIQALIDKELPEDKIEGVISHVESCYKCRKLYIDFLRLDKQLHSVSFKEPPKEWFENLSKRKGRMFFQRFGLFGLLFSNVILLAIVFMNVFFSAPIFEKVLLSTVVGGILILLGVTISDKIHESKGDKYKGVMK